jgi:plastocyanin
MRGPVLHNLLPSPKHPPALEEAGLPASCLRKVARDLRARVRLAHCRPDPLTRRLRPERPVRAPGLQHASRSWTRPIVRACRQPAGLICFSFVLLFQSTAPAATIEGRVELPGVGATTVMNKRYQIVSQGGVLSPSPPVAVVYVEGSFPAPAEQPVAQVLQKDLVFIPSLLPIRTGTRVEFPNMDDTYHNVFSYSPPKRFDLGRFRADERPVPSQVFETAGLVTLRCDIHDHMRALILVLDTPHFVVTAEDGTFRLEGIPPGRHVVKAWIDSRTVREQTVEVGDDGSVARVEFPR